MTSLLRGKHFITTQDWSRQELELALELASDLKRRFATGEPHRLLQDKTLFMMFFEQSTRTRNSMEAGITQLGGHAHDLTPDKMQLSHGETAKDTAVILSRMGHAIACRNCFHGVGNDYLRELAKWSATPVMSLQCDVYHPMQVMADVMVMREYFGRALEGLKVTVSWAYATSHSKPLSVPQSQLLLFTRMGMDVTVAHPKEFPLQMPIVETAQANAKENGGSLRFTDDMDEGVADAQIVIPKNWGGFGLYGDEFVDDEAHRDEMKANVAKNKDWIFDERRLGLTAPGSKMMHALPADRNNEVTDAVIDGPASIVYDEAENRLHTAKAIMALTMGGRP
jgi:ornithine carbamoyltransferase